jgi:hypothetical protein
MRIEDAAARIIEIVLEHEGNPEELLNQVVNLVDDWGQEEYDRALEDYFEDQRWADHD